MKRTFSLMFIFFVLFWPAPNKGQKSESKARVEIIDGVECIHNTATPLYHENKVTFIEDLTISPEDKDGKVVLSEPLLRLVDDKENIYISEIKDKVIKVFGSDGKYIRTIGAKGSGPGEFQGIPNLVVTKDEKLLVLDQNSRRTSFFDSSGRFLKSFQWRTSYYNFIMIKSSSYIVSEIVYSQDRQFQYLFVKEIDFNGEEIRSFGEFTISPPKIIRQDKSTTYISSPVSTVSLFAGDPDRDLFYHCVNNKYLIEVYGTSGKLLGKFDRPYRPVPFTDIDAKAYRARFTNVPNDFLKAIDEMEMPKVKSIVEKMCVDEKGNLWVRTNEIKVEENKILTAFDIFDSKGYYFAKVWTALIPSIFKKGKMYRMDTDPDTGYQSLKRYKVVWE
jgi:hypothetical protein